MELVSWIVEGIVVISAGAMFAMLVVLLVAILFLQQTEEGECSNVSLPECAGAGEVLVLKYV